MRVRAGTRPLRNRAAWLPAVLAALAVPAANAQDGTASGPRFVPTFDVQETLTDNRDLSSANKQSDAVTTVRPGFRIVSNGARLQGSLSYALSAIAYARASELNTVQNALDAAVKAELVENSAYVDARANISQQSISAFGTQGDTTLVNKNRTEVSTASISPSWRGRIGEVAEFNANLNWSVSRSDATELGDSNSHAARLGFSGQRGLLGWGLEGGRQVNSFKNGRTTTTDDLFGSAIFRPDVDLRFTLRLGRQSSDVLSGSAQGTTTYGFSGNWQPTDRTDLTLQGDRNYYGRSHTYSLRHRMARSLWSYSDTTGVSGIPNGQQSAQGNTLFDLLVSICVRQGGSPTDCDESVRQFFLGQGVDPETVRRGSFLNSSLTLQRNRNLSVAYSALRTTFTLSAFRLQTSPLGEVSNAAGDLVPGITIKQQGASLSVTHQLTPISTLTVIGALQKTLDAGPQQGTQQKSLSLSWSFQPGPRTNATLSLRHTQFDSAFNPYHESALIGLLGFRF